MNSICVLIVDDSLLIQKILRKIVTDAGMTVAETASNGQEALSVLAQQSVDLILLDMEMPVMNGIEFLKAMKHTPYSPPIIVISALTQRHAPITIESLLLGASDYIFKPSTLSGGETTNLAATLIPKIQRILEKRAQRTQPSLPPPLILPNRIHSSGSRFGIIVVAVSTGGPKALESLLLQLPAEFSTPILIAQHMPPIFTQMLAESLNSRTALQVKEAQDGDDLSNGGVWLAPGDRHMSIRNTDGKYQIEITDGPKENFCRPSADVLFRSAARHFQQKTIGLVLTGMGQDGLLGSVAIRRRGGSVFVQDEKSSVVWGMPKAIVDAEQANAIIPLKQMGEQLIALFNPPHSP